MPCNDYIGSNEVVYQDNPEDKKKIAELEIELCKVRDILMKIYGKIDTGQQLSVDEELAIKNEKQKHLVHRLEDRDDRLKTLSTLLKRQKEAESKILSLGGSTSKDSKIFKDIQDTNRKIAWIMSLSPEQILNDRYILEKIPEDFSIPVSEENPYTMKDLEKIYRKLKANGRITKNTDDEEIKKMILIETNWGANLDRIQKLIKKFSK